MIPYYLRQLDKGGFMETEYVIGKGSRRWLLLHPDFQAFPEHTPVRSHTPSPEISHQGVRDIVPKSLNQSLKGAEEEQRDISQSVRFKRREAGLEKATPLMNELAKQIEHKIFPYGKPKDGKPQRAFDDSELSAIDRAVQSAGFEVTPLMLANFQRQAATYNANGYRVAAELERALKAVRSKPSLRPQKPAWFWAVTESALKAGAKDAR